MRLYAFARMRCNMKHGSLSIISVIVSRYRCFSYSKPTPFNKDAFESEAKSNQRDGIRFKPVEFHYSHRHAVITVRRGR